MFFTKLAALSTLLAVATAVTINTPASLVECQPASIAFSGGTAPYYLAVLPGGQASASALENLDSTSTSPYTWTVDIASGTSITLRITDANGTIAYTDAVSIQAGSSTSCLSTSSGSSSSGAASAAASSTDAAAASSAASSGASSAAASGSSAAASAAATSKASGSAAAASASASSTTSGALSTRQVAGGLAAVLGFAATAFTVLA